MPSTSFTGGAQPARSPNFVSQAFVIEIGEAQVGLVSRHGDEAFFTFIAASAAYHALDGHRFATPVAAERAALGLRRARRIAS